MKNIFLILSISTFIFSCTKNETPSQEEITENEDENPVIVVETPNTEDPDISNNWEIATWKNFSKSAISHTWDDNTAKQLTNALPIYDEFGFKTTFFITTNWSPNWSGFKIAVENGHEVASHTLSHTSFTGLSNNKTEAELLESKNLIDEKIGENTCLTFAYPYCNNENFNLTKKHYIAARVCSEQIVSQTVTDFMNISSFSCGSETGNKTATDFNTIADNAFDEKGWAVYLFHGIDNDGGYSPVTTAEIKSHLSYLDTNKDKFWIATFGNVIKYMKERESATINQTISNETKITATITDDLDDTIYNAPITIRKEIRASWTNISVKQNNNTIDFSIEKIDNKNYVIFDVIPDAGEIEINK